MRVGDRGRRPRSKSGDRAPAATMVGGKKILKLQGSKMYVLKQNVGVSCLIFLFEKCHFSLCFSHKKKNLETILQQRYLTIKLRRMKGA